MTKRYGIHLKLNKSVFESMCGTLQNKKIPPGFVEVDQNTWSASDEMRTLIGY